MGHVTWKRLEKCFNFGMSVSCIPWETRDDYMHEPEIVCWLMNNTRTSYLYLPCGQPARC